MTFCPWNSQVGFWNYKIINPTILEVNNFFILLLIEKFLAKIIAFENHFQAWCNETVNYSWFDLFIDNDFQPSKCHILCLK
jgi:hypothetical protein